MTRPAAIAALLGIIACDAAGPPGATTTTDSAGVRVVSLAALRSDLESWSLGDPPVLTIGAVDGESPDVFGRIAAAVERSDGSVVIADSYALEIRAFDRNGRHLWTAGSKGEGPGELRTIRRLLLLPGDSLLVTDERQRRGLVFDPDGRFARQFQLEPASPETGQPHIVGALPSGRLAGWFSSGEESTEPGRHRDRIGIGLFSGDGQQLERFAELPGDETILSTPEPGLVLQGDAIWGRRTQIAVGGGAVAATAQDRFEIVRYDPAGTPDLILRVATSPILASDDVRSRLGVNDARAIHLPDTLPALGRIHLDAERRLWVEEYVPPYDDRAPVWWVFDADGIPLASVTVPREFTFQHLAADHVLGVALDSLDVPRIEIRRIVEN